MTKSYKELLPQIKAFVFDMDGVLTNGQFQVSETGQPLRNLNSKDGYALQLAVKKGYVVAVISGGHCDGVKSRLQQMGITDIYMSQYDKTEAWKDLLAVYEHQNLKAENILYMGDDLPDYKLIEWAGVGATPSNGAAEIKGISNYVSSQKGGKGCVRDVIEQTLKVQENWMLANDLKW